MNESEIVLKSVELALQKSQVGLYGDIVKIGIPSMIALAGVVSTYLLTKSSHKKDVEIERLRETYDTKKEINARTGELIKSVTLELTELHHVVLAYSNNLFAKLDMESDGISFPEKNLIELSKQYQKVVDILHESFSIEAKIHLLGNRGVEEKFAKFHTACFELSKNFDPSSPVEKCPSLQNQLLKIRDEKSNLLAELSEIFLIVDN